MDKKKIPYFIPNLVPYLGHLWNENEELNEVSRQFQRTPYKGTRPCNILLRPLKQK